MALSFANAQTTISNLVVEGKMYDVTYNTGTYDSFETGRTNFSSLKWWNDSGFAKSFADAADVNGLNFAFDTLTIGGTDYALYMDTSNSGSQAVAQSASATYAIQAVSVPAPLPFLGILPVIGFLKRMRKRQRG